MWGVSRVDEQHVWIVRPTYYILTIVEDLEVTLSDDQLLIVILGERGKRVRVVDGEDLVPSSDDKARVIGIKPDVSSGVECRLRNETVGELYQREVGGDINYLDVKRGRCTTRKEQSVNNLAH